MRFILPLFVFFAAFPVGSSFGASQRPNLILIIADDLGQQLGCFGDPSAKTPNLDRFASEGVRFTNAHVTVASCSPSRGSMFTGLYPHQHGMFGLSQSGWAQMHDDVPKLPNALKSLGYRTGMIGKSHFEPFDLFQWDTAEVNNMQKINTQRDVRWMNAQAEKFLDAQPSGEPFFLVMSYIDPHRGGGDGAYGPGKNEKFPRVRMGLPENPPSPEETKPIPFLGVDSPDLRREDSDFYSALSRLDTGVGGFLDILKARNLGGDNTLVIFVGDNGPDVTRGKMAAYATATRTPLMIRWPGHDQPGLVRGEPVSTVDLFPTFLAAAGAPAATIDPRQTGLSLLPLLKPGDVAWRKELFTEFITHVPWHFFPRYTVQEGKYHLIHNIEGGKRENPLEPRNYCYAWWEVESPKYDGTPIREVYDRVDNPPEFELFDVSADPHEYHNLASDPANKELVARLAARIADWRKETKDPFLDPGFSKAFEEKVAEMKRKYEAKNGGAH